MSDWSDYQYLLKHHPEATGFDVVPGAKGQFWLVVKECLRSNLANLQYLCWSQKRGDTTEVLVFAETQNQHASLQAMVSALGRRARYIQAALFDGASGDTGQQHVESFALTFSGWVFSLGKSIQMFPLILRESRRYEGVLSRFYVRQLFRSCGYWFWLRRLLKRYPSQWVLTANDHNPWNLMLYDLSRREGRKTAYVQHASVSDIFPALNFDVSFLDGQVARDVYSAIAERHGKSRLDVQSQVCLSGQQKKVTRNLVLGMREEVGLATSSLTKTELARQLLDQLMEEGFRVTLRSHPTESPKRIEEYQQWAHSRNGMCYQKGDVALSEFLDGVGVVLAGDSGILLEAAVSGRQAVYVESL